MTRLLIDERPMMVIPSLAARIGLDEAVVLQQIHYWLDIHEAAAGDRTFKDNRYWVYNTIEDWQKQFRWCATDKINRILLFLERSGLVETDKPDKKSWNQRKWYTINYAAVSALETMEEGAWKLSIDKRAIAIAEYLENAGISTKQHCRNLRQSEQANCGNHLYTEITPEITAKCTKADQNPPRENNVSHLKSIATGCGNGSDKSVSADPIRSVKSSVGDQRLLPPSPCSAPPPSPVRSKVAPHFCTDDYGIIRFPTVGPHKLAGRFALRSTQVWLCAEEMEFEFSRDKSGVFYASDPKNGGWIEERTMFDVYMPMNKIATLLFEHKRDTLKTVDEINKHLMKWFDFWTGFLKDKRLESGKYFSAVRITLKDLGIEWGDVDEDDIA